MINKRLLGCLVIRALVSMGAVGAIAPNPSNIMRKDIETISYIVIP